MRSLTALFDTTPFLLFFYGLLLLTLVLVLTRRWWVDPFRAWYARHYLGAVLGSLLVLFVIVFLGPDLFFTILPGETGVLWSRFGGGTRLEEPYAEGSFLKLPWDRIYKYNMRYQRVTAPIVAVTREGLEIQMVLMARFRPIRERIGYLHKHVGPRYVERLLVPELGAVARQVVAERTAEQVYSQERKAVQDEILAWMRQDLVVNSDQRIDTDAPRVRDENPALTGVRPQIADFLELEDVLVQSVTVPASVARAIESKVVQSHLNEEYIYRLARERNEVLRKGLEGEGIALFQSKVSAGISDRYLKWKGIDATLELAKSPNAKIVVIGSGEGGMPLILGGFAEGTAGGSGAGTGAAGSAAVSPQGAGSELAGQATSVPEADSVIDRLLQGDVNLRDLVRDSTEESESIFVNPEQTPQPPRPPGRPER